MTTRRDYPDGSLWRLAVEGFNRILIDDFCKCAPTSTEPDMMTGRPSRMRIWKEVADVYEIFLVGYCGRAIASNSLSATRLEADEALEMTFLHVLGDKVLKSPIDAPVDVISFPISALAHIHIYMYI